MIRYLRLTTFLIPLSLGIRAYFHISFVKGQGRHWGRIWKYNQILEVLIQIQETYSSCRGYERVSHVDLLGQARK